MIIFLFAVPSQNFPNLPIPPPAQTDQGLDASSKTILVITRPAVKTRRQLLDYHAARSSVWPESRHRAPRLRYHMQAPPTSPSGFTCQDPEDFV